MPVIQTRNKSTGSRKNIFSEEQFAYDEKTNTLICPAGKRLKKRTFHLNRQTIEYMGSRKDCKNCGLLAQCTRNNHGRSVQRHIRKEELDAMLLITKSYKARRDIKTRNTLWNDPMQEVSAMASTGQDGEGYGR